MFWGIFQRIPLILVITLQDRKPLFCVFFLFQGPIRTQIDRGFFEDYYFLIYDETQHLNHANGVTKMEIPRVAVTSRLLTKGRTSVLSAIPWITDSTTVQN